MKEDKQLVSNYCHKKCHKKCFGPSHTFTTGAWEREALKCRILNRNQKFSCGQSELCVLVLMCVYFSVFQRGWRSTSASTARWRSVWWWEIQLLSARGEGAVKLGFCAGAWKFIWAPRFLRAHNISLDSTSPCAPLSLIPSPDVCRGFGFVTFVDQAGVDKVLAQTRHELDSKTVSSLYLLPTTS